MRLEQRRRYPSGWTRQALARSSRARYSAAMSTNSPAAVVIKALVALIALALIAFGALVAYTFANEHRPASVEPVMVEGDGSGPGLKAGQPFKVVSWNLQYGASRKHRFFYDGGEAVHVPAADVAETVAAISAVLAEEAPAISLLQEIDRDSTRTGRLDQLPPYVEAMQATATSSAPYHLAGFVPKPFTNPLGRVHMALGILTRGPHTTAQRHQLALMDEPRVVQALNLKRALLTAEVPVEGLDQPLAIAVTHLSAFSFGDGTLEKQVAALADWMAARPADQPWILAGDFNLLPPGDDKNRLTTESELYADNPNPVEALVPRFRDALGDNQLDPKLRTYLPFGHDEPDRKIDYMLIGGPIHVETSRVMTEHKAISDHLPIVTTFIVGDRPEPDPEVPEAPEGAVVEAP